MVRSGAARTHGLSVAWIADAGTGVVTARGAVDHSSCHVLETVIRDVLAERVDAVVVDVGTVTLLDSAGMRTLVAGWRQAVAHGTKLRVVGVRGYVELVLSVSGVLESLTGTP